MGKSIRGPAWTRELEGLSLSGLIQQQVRVAIETAVHEELRARSVEFLDAKASRMLNVETKTALRV